jgi:T-complex protein 1 subunit eta
VTISNDGATILKLLDIVHPAAKTLVDIARAQDAEVGDGTTSVVVFAGELLREAKPFIEESVPTQVIIRGMSTAAPWLGRTRCLPTRLTRMASPAHARGF